MYKNIAMNLYRKIVYFFRKKRIIGMIRMRNEALILKDTLDHLAQFVDGIIIYDDASTDASVSIAKEHLKVIKIIENDKWQSERAEEETKHRQILLDATKKYNPEWLFYADCDERFEGNIRKYLLSEDSKNVDAIRIRLFDAYITSDDQDAYNDGELYDFRKYFGPECRDILMIWRNSANIKFEGLDKREPILRSSNVITKFYCQHYGKSLSIEHWEETCDYYSEHFPKYADKWRKRKGMAIHKQSDFNRKLYTWKSAKDHSVKID